MKQLKIIFFPIGEHDTAGNKRLKNLSRNLLDYENIKEYFFSPSGDSVKSASGIVGKLKKIILLFADIFRILYILIREREKGSRNILYFYEGRHLMLHRIMAAKILGYKILIDLVENPNALSHTKSITQKIRILYFLFMYKLMPLYANGIIVVSKYLKNKVVEDFKEKVPVLLMPVSYDSDDFKCEKQQYGYPTIFYGGSYGSNYDFDSLFKAFNSVIAEFPQLRLCLSGNIDDSMIKRISEAVTKPENIVFLGFLDEAVYYTTICSMNILCMPRNNTIHANAGFPFKLAEYLATGNPVITSRVSDVADYIADNEAFIYEPGDYGKMASVIKDIFSDPEHANKVGQRGKNKAEKCFDARSVSHEFYQFISDSKL
jgi:glycosyltransferase involved in cell wall biosynthesis